MPQYNAYTNTNDFPTVDDLFINPETGQKIDRITLSKMKNGIIPYANKQALGRSIETMAFSNLGNEIEKWRLKYNIPNWLWDKWKKEARDKFLEDTESNKTWWEKTSAKIKSNVLNYVNKAKELLQKTGQSALLAPLLPFKNAMINALKRSGEQVTSSTPLLQIASLFKQKIVDRKSTTNYLEHADVDAETIMQLVNTILPFFTQIIELVKSKRANENERLMNEDAEKDAEKIAQGGEPDVTGDTALNGKNWFKDNMLLILGVGAVILFLVFRKKK